MMVSTCALWLEPNGNTAPGEVLGSTQGELLWYRNRIENVNGPSLRCKAIKSSQNFSGESSTDEEHVEKRSADELAQRIRQFVNKCRQS
jgi:hypothetical protein